MVEYRWDEKHATKLVADAGDVVADQQLALHAYATRLIGSDPTLVQHGGGNTSCKLVRPDLFGNDMDVMHIKGSGQDMALTEGAKMPVVRMEPLLKLRVFDRLSDADMINQMRSNMVDQTAPMPSVETLLHAFLPHGFINHTHATAMLALADLPNAEECVREIFGDRMACVPFFMPGFALGKAAAEVFEANPKVEGLLLLKHGHFAFAEDPKQAYDLILEHTQMVEDWIQDKLDAPLRQSGPAPAQSIAQASEVFPVLRGIIGQRRAEFANNQDAPMPVFDLRAGPNVQQFLARSDVATLATRGVPTPDHVIRTKNTPLYLTQAQIKAGAPAITAAVDAYTAAYRVYFDHNAALSEETKTMLDPTPNLAWLEGIGIVGMGQNAKAAAVAGDLAEQAIAAMTYGETCGGFFPVGEEQLFEMEYWSLEQAKLGKSTPPAFSGRVVLVTGGAGAIGLATAQAFAAKGASVFLVDLDEDTLGNALMSLGNQHSGIALDITADGAAEAAINACVTRFGGVDILVSNAGAAWTGEMSALDDATLRKSFELNFFAHQNLAKAASRVLTSQGRGGQILFNVSKQAVNPGKGFGAYGIPKAATMFLLRQLALELGAKGIRVNGINADRIRSGLLDDAFIAERANARGIDEGAYMAGNLLQREVEASHVADAFVALAQSERTTAHVMTVDGGNIEAALR